MKKNIITFGTFDVFHIGHLKILERAKSLGTYLIVGVSTDKLNVHKKGRIPIYNENQRIEIIGGLKCVDETFLEESLELKRDYIVRHQADVLAMGNDWEGKFDEFKDICEVVYFERTPSISTTAIIELIKK